MRKVNLFLLSAVFLLTTSVFAQQAAPAIQGEYLETRSADVYTGQCFANSEMNLTGDEAILAWHVREGKWDGVALNGLTVGAAVKAHATLGDPYGKPYPAKAVLFVDKNATPVQRQALINFAQQMGGELLRHVVRVMDVPVNMDVLSQHSMRAELQAGNFITVKTRAIGPNDHLCGNEDTFYPPLTKTTHAMPAVAVTNSYSGKDLNDTWELHDKRSAFVGAFATNQQVASR